MSSDPSQSAWEVLKQLVGGIKNQLLLFALATIIVIALLGTSIPSTFIVLIYIVVIFALIIAALPAVKAALRSRSVPVRRAPAALTCGTATPTSKEMSSGAIRSS